MIRVSNYIAGYLADFGVQQVFLLSGGGAMYLNNALGTEPRLRYICNHHEQACAMAAEAYWKVSGRLPVVNVTTGPGAINAINGVFGAWTDSVPMLVLSGQAKRETCAGYHGLKGLRQLGEQEADVIPMISGITKYAALVREPESIRYHLERALHTALAGRRGPCWLDIPVDVQGAMVDETQLAGYTPEQGSAPEWDMARVAEQCREVLCRIRTARRPVILCGSGVRLAGAEQEFETLIDRLGVPVVPSRSAHDLIDARHPLMAGYPGIDCDRAGNLAVQNSDLLVVLGSRLGVRLTSYNWKAFAREAFKIQVDIDPLELDKPTLKPDLGIHCDLKVFLEELNRQAAAGADGWAGRPEWVAWCKERVRRYPAVLPRHREPGKYINPYHFCEVLFECLEDDECIVCANGAAYQVPLQVAQMRKGQRLIFNNGCMSMGYELPAAIGAAIARNGKRVVCMAGDGSMQLNIQELQTIVHHRLPVKIFVWNNSGYLSIRLTQQNFFQQYVGESARSGVSFPDMTAIARAYGIDAVRLEGRDFAGGLRDALRSPGACLVDVILDPEQAFEPKVASRRLPDGTIVSAPPEDMFPFLSREEVAENLLIAPLDAQ